MSVKDFESRTLIIVVLFNSTFYPWIIWKLQIFCTYIQHQNGPLIWFYSSSFISTNRQKAQVNINLKLLFDQQWLTRSTASTSSKFFQVTIPKKGKIKSDRKHRVPTKHSNIVSKRENQEVTQKVLTQNGTNGWTIVGAKLWQRANFFV